MFVMKQTSPTLGSLWSLDDVDDEIVVRGGHVIIDHRRDDRQTEGSPGLTALVVGIEKSEYLTTWVRIVHGGSVSRIVLNHFLCHFSSLDRNPPNEGERRGK